MKKAGYIMKVRTANSAKRFSSWYLRTPKHLFKRRWLLLLLVHWFENLVAHIKGMGWGLPFTQAPFLGRTTSTDYLYFHTFWFIKPASNIPCIARFSVPTDSNFRGEFNDDIHHGFRHDQGNPAMVEGQLSNKRITAGLDIDWHLLSEQLQVFTPYLP